ncbi:MAG: hypothetical protein JO033_03445 [Acidobacteriaceae bacterium]|nr:hypothetical protein [Acidobacteriaceae bacterium]
MGQFGRAADGQSGHTDGLDELEDQWGDKGTKSYRELTPRVACADP